VWNNGVEVWGSWRTSLAAPVFFRAIRYSSFAIRKDDTAVNE